MLSVISDDLYKFIEIEQYLVSYYLSLFDDMYDNLKEYNDIEKLLERLDAIKFYNSKYNKSYIETKNYLSDLESNLNQNNFLEKSLTTTEFSDKINKINNQLKEEEIDNINEIKINLSNDNKKNPSLNFLKSYFGHTEDYLFFNLFFSKDEESSEYKQDFQKVIKIIEDLAKSIKDITETEVILKIFSYRKVCIKCRHILFLLKICLHQILKNTRFQNVKINIIFEYLHLQNNKISRSFNQYCPYDICFRL